VCPGKCSPAIVGIKTGHMQLAETARYIAYVTACGTIYAEYLDITNSWTDLVGILTERARISHMQLAEYARYTHFIWIYGQVYAQHFGVTICNNQVHDIQRIY
jgi:hypothetical protein